MTDKLYLGTKLLFRHHHLYCSLCQQVHKAVTFFFHCALSLQDGTQVPQLPLVISYFLFLFFFIASRIFLSLIPPVLTPMSSISISSYSFIELSGVSLVCNSLKCPVLLYILVFLSFYLLSFFGLYCIIFPLPLFVIVLVSMLPDILPVHSLLLFPPLQPGFPSISFQPLVSHISLLYLSLYCK